MRKVYLLLLVISSYLSSYSQTVFSENVGSPSATTSIATYTGWQNNGVLTFSNGGQTNSADVRNTSPSSTYAGASGNGNVFFTTTSGAYGFSIESINASSYTGLTLQFGYRKESATVHATFSVDYWDGASWVTVANTSSALFNEIATASTGWYLSKSLALPAGAQINGLKIRFVKTGTASIRVDDVKLTGTIACTGAPTAQAGFGTVTPATTSATVNFTAGTGGTGRVAKINTANSFVDMVDGANPAAATAYAGGEQVIYNGTGTGPVTVTGLSAATTYYLAVYEYNCASGRFYLNPGATTSFTTSASITPTKFAITSISPTSPTAGSGFSVTVKSVDNSDVPQNVVANTSFSLSTNGNAGTIGGTITGTINAGSNTVTVNGVTLSTAGTGATITATQTSGDPLAAGTSAPFNVLAAANHLTFVGVPSSGTVGTNLTTFTVEARRPDNTVDNTFTGNITITKASGPGNLSGTNVVAATAGVASFSTLQLDAAGSYTLNAAASGLTPDVSGTITINNVPVSLGGWDVSPMPGGTDNFGTNPLPPSTTTTNVTLGSLTKGSGVVVTGAGAARGWGGLGWDNATAALSIAANKYFTFTVKSNTGYNLSLSSINPFDYRRSGTGATSGLVQYQIDNGSFVDITTLSFPNSASTGASAGPIDLSGISALQNVPSSSTVTFRIVPYGASGSGGTFYIFDVANSTANDLAINGYVSPGSSINSFTPTSGYTGTSVVITGTNLTGATAVSIGGTAVASFIVDSPTQITAIVGAGTSGTISVTTPLNTATSSGSFTYLGYVTAQAGTWNTGSTWLGGNVPPSGANVTINHAVSLDVSATVNNFTVGTSSLTLGANNLTVNGNITGGGTSAYIKTNGSGVVTVNNVTTSARSIPVGNSTYNGLTIVNGSGLNWSARVEDAVNNVTPPFDATKAINRTWHISPSGTITSGPDVTFNFDDADNSQLVNPAAYNGDASRVAQFWHYGSSWIAASGAVNMTPAAGPQSLTLSGYLYYSPFAIAKISGPLPVKFANLRAYQTGTGVFVEWANLTESNMQNYRVERSADGVTYTSIGTVDATRNDNGRADYGFRDATPVNGVNYYRIVSNEVTGKQLTSIVVRVDLRGGATDLVIYPNPASGNVVSLQARSLVKGDYTIRVFAANGQQVYSRSLQHAGGAVTESIVLPSSIKPGLYSIQLASDESKWIKMFLVR